MNKLYAHDSVNNTHRLLTCDESGNLVTISKIGTQGNLWNAASVLADGVSSVVDLNCHTKLATYGSSDAVATLTMECSANNSNYYNPNATVDVVNGDFYLCMQFPARYIRLSSSANATVTANVSASS